MRLFFIAFCASAAAVFFFSTCKKEDNPPASCPDCPSITTLTPNFGSPGDTITITGKNFAGLQRVQFGTEEAEVLVGATATTIKVIAPDLNKTGAVDVIVVRNFQPPSSPTVVLKSEELGFTYAPLAPLISGLSPTSGTSGTVVSITGSRFENLKAVRFAGVNATVQNKNATALTVTVPNLNVSGQVPVVVVTEYAIGGSGLQENPSNTFNFVYQGPMNITSFSPQTGKKGDVVTISGSGFGNSTSGISVSFNGISATIQSVNDAEISVVVPAKAGTGKITVVKGIASASTINDFIFQFTYTVSTLATLPNYPIGIDHFNGRTITTASINYDNQYSIYVESIFSVSETGAFTQFSTPASTYGTLFTRGGGFRPDGTYYFGGGASSSGEGYMGIILPNSNSVGKITGAGQILCTDLLWTSNSDLKVAFFTFAFGLSDFTPGVGIGSGTIYLNGFNCVTPAGADGPIPGCHIARGLAYYSGELYFVDENSIHKISGNQIVRITGQHSSPGFADGILSQARFNGMEGIVIASEGKAYVTDSKNNSVRLIDLINGQVTTIAGSNTQSSGDVDGIGSSARFFQPVGICLDSDGNLLVADSKNKKIRKITID